jgi:hypothetical protein
MRNGQEVNTGHNYPHDDCEDYIQGVRFHSLHKLLVVRHFSFFDFALQYSPRTVFNVTTQ